MPNLRDAAVLVHLRCTSWSTLRRARILEGEIATEHQAHPNAIRAQKRLLDTPVVAEIRSLLAALRETHYRLTLPWMDDGRRLLPLRFHLRHLDAIQDAETKLDTLRERLRDEYETLLAFDRARLGSLFFRKDYPEAAKLAAAFSIDCRLEPVPNATDLRIDLPEEEIARLRLRIEEQQQLALSAATTHLWSELRGALKPFVERLEDPKGRIRGALLRNLLELCDRLATLNLAGDTDLDAMRGALLADLGSVDLDSVREEPGLRAAVAAQARARLDAIDRRTAGLFFEEPAASDAA